MAGHAVIGAHVTHTHRFLQITKADGLTFECRRPSAQKLACPAISSLVAFTILPANRLEVALDAFQFLGSEWLVAESLAVLLIFLSALPGFHDIVFNIPAGQVISVLRN